MKKIARAVAGFAAGTISVTATWVLLSALAVAMVSCSGCASSGFGADGDSYPEVERWWR